MAIFRVEKTRDYVVMAKHHLRDKELSLKSKGLLTLMLSLPEEWNYTTRGLAAICKEGVDSIGSALKELENAGYIVRNRLRDEKGRIFDTEYTIYEQPQKKADEEDAKPNIDEQKVSKHFTVGPETTKQNATKTEPVKVHKKPNCEEPDTASPYTENPYTVEPPTENHSQLSNNKTSNNLLNNVLLNTNPINQSVPVAKSTQFKNETNMIDRTDEIDAYRELIKNNIEYDCLCTRYGVERTDEIVDLMLDAVCSKRKSIRIGGEDFPASIVKNRMLKLTFGHIEYVFDCLDKNTTKINNIKSYLLTSLYNSYVTMDSFYRAEVNHDMYGN